MAQTYNLDTRYKREAENLELVKRMRSGFAQSQKQSPVATLLLIVLSCAPLLFLEQAKTLMSDLGLTKKGSSQVAMLTKSEQAGSHGKKSGHGAKHRARKHGR
jgi:hypothetical protein